MFQQIMVIGNLGTDVTMRYTPSGVPVSSFSVAANRSWVDANGTKQERVTWWKVSCWRKQAEVMAEYLHKGDRVMVIGEELEAKVYQNKNGEWVTSLELTAQTVKFLTPKGESGNSNGAEPKQARPAQPATASVEDQEIPF